VAGEQHKGDEVLVAEAALTGGFGCRGDLALGQPVELLRGVHYDGEGVGVGEQVLFEAGGEGGEPQIVVAEGIFLVRAQPGAGLGELGEVALHQVGALGVEVELGELVVHGGDPAVEGGVEADRVGVGGQQRCQLLLERVGELAAIG
jgi:hypothetical protein